MNSISTFEQTKGTNIRLMNQLEMTRDEETVGKQDENLSQNAETQSKNQSR